MISFVWAVAGIGVLLYIAALYESASLAVFAFFLAGYVVLAFALLVHRLLCLKVSMEIPMVLAQCKRPVGICFTVQTARALLGKSVLRVQVVAYQLPHGKKHKTWICLEAGAEGVISTRKEVTMYHAGGYEYRLCRMRVYDWTGIFSLTKRIDQRATVQLLPELHELPVRISGAVRNYIGEAETYDDLRGGSDIAEVFQIRSYIPGDRLQNIHWKLSAKSQELMVREHSQPKGCAIVLLLGTKGRRRQRAVQRDHFLQIAAAVSFALIDAECPHIVSWYDVTSQDLVRVRVDDEASFFEWQLWYLIAGIPQQKIDVETRYREKYQNEPILQYLCIDPDLQIRLNGIHLHTFAKKGSIKEELKEFQLYL